MHTVSGNGDVKVIGTSTDVDIIEASGTTTFTGAATSLDVSSDGTRVVVGTSSKMYVVNKSGGAWAQLGSEIEQRSRTTYLTRRYVTTSLMICRMINPRVWRMETGVCCHHVIRVRGYIPSYEKGTSYFFGPGAGMVILELIYPYKA